MAERDNVIKVPSFSNQKRDLTGMLFDKVPPQARDLEEAVLGALMLDKDAVAYVVDILKPESFYDERNGKIYEAIQDLFNRTKPIDLLTVTEQLRKNGSLEECGGIFYVTQMTNKIGNTANVEEHARIIIEKYILRELVKTSNTVIKSAYDETTDVFDLLDKAEGNLFEITDQNLKRGTEKISNLMVKAIRQMEDMKDSENSTIGIPTGFAEFDRITQGWQKSDLVIIAARPGMGKTAFALTVARNAAIDYKKPVALFSLEMSSVQLVNRLIASEAEFSSTKLKSGDFAPHEWQQLTTRIETLREAPIFIDDTPAINIFELRAKCRRLKQQNDIQLIVIDYLQLMSGGGKNQGNREQEISMISRSLKSIAKELDVPVIALSQLNRSVETRGGTKKPQLSDLRESGAIEQDADMVIFLYRAEYYNIEYDEDNLPTKGLAEIIISKHRNGSLANIKSRFIGQYTKFEDMELGDGISGGMPSTITVESSMNEGYSRSLHNHSSENDNPTKDLEEWNRLDEDKDDDNESNPPF